MWKAKSDVQAETFFGGFISESQSLRGKSPTMMNAFLWLAIFFSPHSFSLLFSLINDIFDGGDAAEEDFFLSLAFSVLDS